MSGWKPVFYTGKTQFKVYPTFTDPDATTNNIPSGQEWNFYKIEHGNQNSVSCVLTNTYSYNNSAYVFLQAQGGTSYNNFNGEYQTPFVGGGGQYAYLKIPFSSNQQQTLAWNFYGPGDSRMLSFFINNVEVFSLAPGGNANASNAGQGGWYGEFPANSAAYMYINPPFYEGLTQTVDSGSENNSYVQVIPPYSPTTPHNFPNSGYWVYTGMSKEVGYNGNLYETYSVVNGPDSVVKLILPAAEY